MQVESIDKIIERVSSHKGVEGVIITDKDGSAIQTTMDNTNTVMYAEGVKNMTVIAISMIRDIDPTDELLFMRIGTKKLEIMANVDPDYTAIVVQSRQKNKKNE